jgi:hypothetical protein
VHGELTPRTMAGLFVRCLTIEVEWKGGDHVIVPSRTRLGGLKKAMKNINALVPQWSSNLIFSVNIFTRVGA